MNRTIWQLVRFKISATLVRVSILLLSEMFPISNITLYAKWKIIRFMVKFDTKRDNVVPAIELLALIRENPYTLLKHLKNRQIKMSVFKS